MNISFKNLLLHIMVDRFYLSKNGSSLSAEIFRFFMSGLGVNLIVFILYQIFIFYINYNIAAILVLSIGYLLTLIMNNFYVYKNNDLRLMDSVKFTFFYFINCFLFFYILRSLVENLNFLPRLSVAFPMLSSAIINFVFSRLSLKRRKNNN